VWSENIDLNRNALEKKDEIFILKPNLKLKILFLIDFLYNDIFTRWCFLK
jgi:hypothetical protein